VDPSPVGDMMITVKSHRFRVGTTLLVCQVEIITTAGYGPVDPSPVGDVMLQVQSQILQQPATLQNA